MQSITINITDKKLADKVTWLLKHFTGEGLEIVSIEDLEDLKAIKKTRNEESIPFEKYLEDEN